MVHLHKEDGIVIRLKKNQKRPGEYAWTAVLDELVGHGVLRPNDWLCTDNEASLKTEVGMDFVNLHDVQRGFFPTYLGSLMNPCDNAFHSVLKRRYNDAIGTFQKPSEHDKIFTALEAFYAIDEQTVRNYFEHVGLSRGRPAEVVDRLLNEGREFSRSWRPLHEEQLRAYAAWREHNAEPVFAGDDDEPVEEEQANELRSLRSKRARRNTK